MLNSQRSFHFKTSRSNYFRICSYLLIALLIPLLPSMVLTTSGSNLLGSSASNLPLNNGATTSVGNSTTTASTTTETITEPSYNVTQSGNISPLHAYSNGGILVSNQSVADLDGNQVKAEVMGYVFNPLYDSDPNFDYYTFNVYASVSSNANDNWFVDSAGLAYPNGPSLELYAFTPCYSNQTIIDNQIQPATFTNASGSLPISTSDTTTISGSVSAYGVTVSGSYSTTVSTTFYPVVGETQPSQQSSQCYVSWVSAAEDQWQSRDIFVSI